MPLVETLAVLLGLALVAIGLLDVFLTILHPDRDGPAAVAVNRATWRLVVAVACAFPRAAREVASTAGAAMIALTILLWMALPVLGFALVAWPFLDTGFAHAAEGEPGFLDALYWSGVTFTTLGYGDVAPVTPLWRAVALVEALAGFALVGAAVTFLLGVFGGIDLRDKMALRIYSETRRTWDGTTFVVRILKEEGLERLLAHLETWAEQMRSLHERLYRFQPLAFYLRTRSRRHEPERMLQAVAEVALAARILARAPRFRAILPAADEIAIAYAEFAEGALQHHGSRRAVRAFQRAEPAAEDAARVRAVWERVRVLGEDAPPWESVADDRELLVLAAQVRVFLEELDRITRWRSLQGSGG